MVHWRQWFLLLLAWFSGLVSMFFWPRLEQTHEEQVHMGWLEAMTTMIFLRPFTYIISLVMLFVCIWLCCRLLRWILYESRLKYLMGFYPVQPLFLLLVLLIVCMQMLLFYEWFAFILILILFNYELWLFWQKKKAEVTLTHEAPLSQKDSFSHQDAFSHQNSFSREDS